ncbi:replication initiation protein, partial [Escherichia coli]|nr:replication initiation protein [Escherichia coli]EIQ9245739.1 replication initiation protein [Escherichia coli]
MALRNNKRNDCNDVQSLLTQGNQLLEGAYDITLIEMRLLYLALTKIDSRKPQPASEYTLFAKEYRDAFSLDSKNCYEQLKSAASSLGSKPIVTYEWNETKKRIDAVKRFWFSSIRYGVGNSESDITLRFSDSVSQYLYELKSEFTQMNLEHMVKLDTPFSFRLYSWLYKYKNLSRNKKESGVISTDPITIEWMKERTGLTGKYPVYKDFKKRVLDPAVDIINANTNLSVTYEGIKSGKRIESVVFTYLVENETTHGKKMAVKPLRPRMPSRPRVVKGSLAEATWARNCLNVMRGYLVALKEYDHTLKLSSSDVAKVVVWCEI